MADRFAHVPIPEGYAALPFPARAVWNALCFHQRWQDGKPIPMGCFPSQATIAKTAGVSVSTVYRGIKQLEARGWIARMYSHFGSAIDSTHYILLAAGMEPPVSGTTANVNLKGASSQKEGGHRSERPTNNTSINNTKNTTRGNNRPPGDDDEMLRQRAEARRKDPFYS